jgi:hypothetical protein
MLLVQKYLETHTFGDLVRDHGVYASFSKSGHKFSLNYDQIEAKEADPLAQECRGLVLSTPDGSVFKKEIVFEGKIVNREDLPVGPTVILAYPMKRFFNLGQGSAAEINWSDPKLSVLEKLDGTLCIVYWDQFTGKWCVATRSVPEADLLMDNGIFTFRTLFEKALEETTGYGFEGFKWFLAKECTYCFELTTRYNRIVVDYPNNGVTLLAIRNLVTLSEVDFDHPYFDGLPKKLPIVQAYALPTVEKTLEWVSSLNPMEHEGVVVKVGENRIKVKNPAYVAYNKVRDALATSPRNMVELILTEKDDDVIPMLPEEIVKNLQVIKAGVQKTIKQHDEAYLVAKAQADNTMLGDKKTFAILVTQNKQLWTAPFFQMFDGKASNMKDFIMKSRGKDGSWGNSFLDKMLELAKS